MTFVDPGNLRTSWLGKRLRELRRGLGINSTTAAAHIDRSQSLLSKIENGKTPIGRAELEGLLLLYGVDRAQREATAAPARPAGREGVVERLLRGHQRARHRPRLAGVDRHGDRRAFCITVLDALLQTSDYTRTVAAATVAPAVPVDPWLQMVATRQTVLARTDPPAYSALIDEALLLRPIGGREVMAAQLRHLLALNRRAHVEIRVLPLDAGAHASPDSGFRVFDLPSPLTQAAAVGSALGTLLVEPPRSHDVAERYDALRQAALEPGPSAELIADLATRLERA